ncbi:hypothetical protein PR048_024502 [Dryococelus australis]|uniref:CRIB domain-containing protein n=1 Tax=Dryococelus australis TaxID=614101 RepID=A0ABQ9GNR3_9NEOP|nr:hypothetical protein PR048_024502 [Dryococelus australis]
MLKCAYVCTEQWRVWNCRKRSETGCDVGMSVVLQVRMSGYQSGGMAGEMWVQWFSCCINQPAAQQVRRSPSPPLFLPFRRGLAHVQVCITRRNILEAELYEGFRKVVGNRGLTIALDLSVATPRPALAKCSVQSLSHVRWLQSRWSRRPESQHVFAPEPECGVVDTRHTLPQLFCCGCREVKNCELSPSGAAAARRIERPPLAEANNPGSIPRPRKRQQQQQRRTRQRIDRSMIGEPTNFQHTGHIGSGDVDMGTSHLRALQNQMQSKGGYETAFPVKVRTSGR